MTHEDEKELAALREQEAALAMKVKGERSPHVGRCHERRLARVFLIQMAMQHYIRRTQPHHRTFLERIGPASA